tara:strand:- start:126 stop:1223 length:1098 start_codon:yes stop_codon:yes gene_type:complete
MSRARTFADLATAYGQGNALGKRNMAFNGDMAVSQRATSTTNVGATSAHNPTLDRYRYQASTSGRATVSQAAITDLAGFRFAQKIDVTTADTSIAAGEYFIINQMFEGFDVQRLQYGTSDAKTVTVSFYVKGTAKTYVAELVTQSSFTSQTFNVTTSWNRVSLTYPANTADTLNQDNTNEFQLAIWLHAGSSYSGGGSLNSTWGTTAANRAVGIGSIFSSTDNELFITGLQIETGDVATPFEYESFETNLARCQRYFYAPVPKGTTSSYFCDAWAYSSSLAAGWITHPVQMRTTPTLTSSDGSNDFSFYRNGGTDYFDILVLNTANPRGTMVYNDAQISSTAGHAGAFYNGDSTNCFLYLDAELS